MGGGKNLMVYIQKRVFVVHVACKATSSSINFGVNAYINTGTGSNPGRRLIPQNLRLNAVLKFFLRKTTKTWGVELQTCVA